MNPEPTKGTCKHCGLEIHCGVWFDARGVGHEGVWSHLGGGLLCARGGVATPKVPERARGARP